MGAALVIVFALNAPSLALGWFGDDYAHRRFILDHLAAKPSGVAWWNMFDWRALAGGAPDPGSLFGRLPWWASPRFSFALLRPLSAASHFLDYLLWPSTPWLMHLHNIAILIGSVLLAASLYRRLFGARASAWLAIALFAIADAHTTSAAWIASRNTLLTALFVLLTLGLYVRAVRDSSAIAARSAPIALLCAHACSEGAMVAWAYLVAYALCLDSRPIAARVRSLLPLGAVTLAWLVVCALFGYGIRGSAVYIDPRHNPRLFAAAVAQRLPELIEMQLVLPREFVNTQLEPVRSLWSYGMSAYAVGLVAGVIAFWRAPLVRFFALASVAALLPQCAAGSFARLLLLSGFAAQGLLAAIFDALTRSSRALKRPALAVFGGATLVLHGVAAIQLPPGARAFSGVIDASVMRAASSLPAGSAASTIVALNFPDYLRSVFVDLYRRERLPSGPKRMDFLGVSALPVTITRVASDAIELEADGGYLLDPTNLLVRTPSDRFQVGQRFELGALTLTVVRTTADGRPERVRVRGDELESPAWLWMCWSVAAQRFERCTLPEIGSSRAADLGT